MRATRYVIYFVGGILIVSYLAFDIIGAFISLGVIGLAISFGLGGVISSWLAGITVMIDRTFSVGDEVKVGVFEGTVRKISIRKTILETKDGEVIFVPNSYFLSFPVSRKKHPEGAGIVHKHEES